MNSLPFFIAQNFNIDVKIINNIFSKLSEEDIDIVSKRFTSREMSQEALLKYYGVVVPKIRGLIINEKRKLNLIDSTYEKHSADFISLDEYAAIYKKMKNGLYKELINELNPMEIMIVLMSIISINNKYYSNNEISEILNITPQEVTEILKKVFKLSKQKIKKI